MPNNEKKSPSGNAPTEPMNSVQELDAEEVTGSEAEFKRFLEVAATLSAAELFTCRADGSLIYHNAVRGVEAVKARSQEIAEHLPKVNLAELLEIPSIGLGLIFAISAYHNLLKDQSIIKPLLRKARGLRHILITALDATAAAGLISSEAVAKIRAGKGPIDTAQDCVDTAALLRANAAALSGKTAVTAEQIKEASEIGTQLLTLLKPAAAVREKEPVPGAAQAAEHRDRLYTLLVGRHARLTKVGGYLWGREVNDHVPPLHTRVVAKKGK